MYGLVFSLHTTASATVSTSKGTDYRHSPNVTRSVQWSTLDLKNSVIREKIFMRFAEGMFARLCLSMEREMFARVSDKGETCSQDCLTREREMFARMSDKGETCWQDCLTREKEMFTMLYLTTRRDVRQNVEVFERRLAKEVNGKFARLQRKCSRDCTEEIREVVDSELTKL